MKKINKYKHQIVLIFLFIAGVLFVNYAYKPKNRVCPQDFINPSERFDSFFEWEKEFRQNNPKAGMPELKEARKDFYIEHNCKEPLFEPHYDNIERDAEQQQFLNIIENYNL